MLLGMHDGHKRARQHSNVHSISGKATQHSTTQHSTRTHSERASSKRQRGRQPVHTCARQTLITPSAPPAHTQSSTTSTCNTAAPPLCPMYACRMSACIRMHARVRQRIRARVKVGRTARRINQPNAHTHIRARGHRTHKCNEHTSKEIKTRKHSGASASPMGSARKGREAQRHGARRGVPAPSWRRG